MFYAAASLKCVLAFPLTSYILCNRYWQRPKKNIKIPAVDLLFLKVNKTRKAGKKNYLKGCCQCEKRSSTFSQEDLQHAFQSRN